MEYNRVAIAAFAVQGKEIVTNNYENKFAEMWDDFFKTYSVGQPVAVYTNYESDYSGKFTFIVGTIVEKDIDCKIFEGGEYIVFNLTDRNQVVECWQFIWSHDLNRLYTSDFEFYNTDGSVDIYIAVR